MGSKFKDAGIGLLVVAVMFFFIVVCGNTESAYYTKKCAPGVVVYSPPYPSADERVQVSCWNPAPAPTKNSDWDDPYYYSSDYEAPLAPYSPEPYYPMPTPHSDWSPMPCSKFVNIEDCRWHNIRNGHFYKPPTDHGVADLLVYPPH